MWVAQHARSLFAAVHCQCSHRPELLQHARKAWHERLNAMPLPVHPDALLAVATLQGLGASRIIELADRDRCCSVVVYLLSGDCDLALHWARLQQVQKCRWKLGLAWSLDEHTLRRWVRQFGEHPEVLRAMADPSHIWRVRLHRFLVESVVAESVWLLGNTGLLVPSGAVVRKYIILLKSLPLPRCFVSDHLRSLSENCNAGKKWSRRFRLNWGLRWGEQQMAHGVSDTQAKLRAGIMFRWVRFALAERCAGRPVVVVNMDETMLSNVKAWKRGVVCSKVLDGPAGGGSIFKQSSMGRTSLIACVASHPGMQRHLPQVRLPRAREPGKLPSRESRKNFEDAGYPQAAWHGDNGWNTTKSMSWWLRRLKTCRDKHASGHGLVLVMDAASMHLSDAIVKLAAQLQIILVIIPARMTWALQPCDTHVFAALKRCIRNLEFEAQASEGRRGVAPLRRVLMHGQAIRKVLVETDWSRTMARSGLTGSIASVRPALAILLDGQDLAPREPSLSEMQEVLQVSPSRLPALMRALCPPRDEFQPRRLVAAAGAASSAAPGVAFEAPHVLVPVLRLAPLSRLPSQRLAERAAGNLFLLGSPFARPVTRSMARVRAVAVVADPGSSSQTPASKRQRL